jgi:hypothetical protein
MPTLSRQPSPGKVPVVERARTAAASRELIRKLWQTPLSSDVGAPLTGDARHFPPTRCGGLVVLSPAELVLRWVRAGGR